MDTIETYIDQAVDLLQKLEGAPAILLIALLCLSAGYALRFWKKFPNDAIPVVVMLLGATYALIADANNDTPLRVWMVRNVVVGLIIGFLTWVAHKTVLKKIELKVPILGPMLASLDAPDPTPPVPAVPQPPTPDQKP